MEKLKQWFKAKLKPTYRVSRYGMSYYIERRPWWSPVFLYYVGHYSSLEQAEEDLMGEIQKQKEAGVVKYLGRL